MTRFKRILKRIAQILLVAVLALLVVSGLLRFYWGRQIETRLAAIKATGQPVCVADLQGKSVPEEDNAAPIYEQAFRLMAKPARRPDFIDDLNSILYSPKSTPSPADWAAAKAALTRSADILALISEAQSRPACQFPLRFDSPETLFDQLAKLRDVTRLLCASAALNAHEGKTQEVVIYTKSALMVNDAVGENSALIIDYLCWVATTKITLANLRQALHFCQLSESQLRQLDDALSRINSAEFYRHALQGERVFGLQQMAGWRKASLVMPLGNGDTLAYKASWVMPLGNGDTLAYLDFSAKQIASARMTYSAARSKGLIGSEAEDQVPFYAIITGSIVPVFQRANVERYKCEAEIACGRVFLALQAYGAKFGRYPQSLAELKTGIDWKLPADPFTGKNLIYKPGQKGFILYSVGPDQKDDGGMNLQSGGQTIPHGDIVWKMVDSLYTSP